MWIKLDDVFYIFCCPWSVTSLRRMILCRPCVISGLRRQVHETCALLGYYAASSGDLLPTLRDKQSNQSSGVKNPNPWRWGDRLSRNVVKRSPLLAAVMTQKSAVLIWCLFYYNTNRLHIQSTLPFYNENIILHGTYIIKTVLMSSFLYFICHFTRSAALRGAYN